MLTNPESRRALRSAVQALVALALVALAWWLTELLKTDNRALIEIARIALGIVGLGTLGYAFENGMRAFKLSAGRDGVTFEAGGQNGGEP